MVSEIGKSNVHVIISPDDMRKEIRDIEIDSITWEDELYSQIEASLKPYEAQPSDIDND